MLLEKSPAMSKAVGILKELSQDERTRLIFEAREKARRDEASRTNHAIKEAVQNAIKETKNEFILKSLQKNIPVKT